MHLRMDGSCCPLGKQSAPSDFISCMYSAQPLSATAHTSPCTSLFTTRHAEHQSALPPIQLVLSCEGAQLHTRSHSSGFAELSGAAGSLSALLHAAGSPVCQPCALPDPGGFTLLGS